jgi:hypothetical protein
MSCLLFDLRRWLRHPGLVATWLSLVVLGGVLSWLDPESAMPFFAPLLAVFLAAADTAEGLRRGAWDFLVSRGPAIERWLTARFGFAVAASAVVLAAHLGANVAAGGTSPKEVFAWVATMVYWAGVGVAVSFWLPAAAAVTLAVLTTVLGSWWVLSGCLWLTGLPAQEVPWLSKGIMTALTVWPVGGVPELLGTTSWGWEAVRLLGGLALLALAARHAARRPLLPREEG